MSVPQSDPLADPASHAAPFRSGEMRVEPDWIDYNGHLNMAYYNVLFDRGVDEVYEALGLGPDYLKRTNHSSYTAEVHVTYLDELHAGDAVTVTFQLLDCDAKRVHFFQEMWRADGTLSATAEQMSLHVDMAAKKVSPFPDAIMARLEAMRRAHAALPNKPQVGHVIGIRRKRT